MVIKKRNLFRLTRFILLKLPYLFRFFYKFRSPRKRILLIKTDAIGDYVLFRNFLEVLKSSEKFKDYDIDVLGNSVWSDIALWYDQPFVHKFTFIKPNELYEAPAKVFGLGWKLFNAKYDLVMQPSYTRNIINDGLAALTGTMNIIGYKSDNEALAPRYKAKTDQFYSELLALPQQYYFEFDRTRYFFEQVLKHPVDLAGPYFPAKNTGRQGITLFLGAGNHKRGWQTENFLQLMELIIGETGQPVHLLGGPEVEETAAYLKSAFPEDSVINLAGKTTLPQLIDHITRTSLVICNETSAVHIAAACNTKTVCILGGGHFGRFAPYPEHVHNRTVFVYEKMPCFNCNWICIYDTPPDAPFPCVGNVTLVKAWQAVQLQLGN
ncbi:MAG TPA: glycosyltransferase family 9 protein [Mucilaginibacter sp.]|jgi:ADP-heptose:LPS heptosyltransferase|nr:glycosyltransferase family 9 protein [Mucilaginibacter sp.]